MTLNDCKEEKGRGSLGTGVGGVPVPVEVSGPDSVSGGLFCQPLNYFYQ